MKSFLACFVFVAVFVKLQAVPTESPYNAEDGMKKMGDLIADLTKKWDENTGMHSDFDKEKFLKAGKGMLEKFSEAQGKFKEAVDSQLKNLPNSEEMKKKIENVQKQITEAMSNLNSPEIQKSTEKLRETITTSFKKVCDSMSELVQKAGVAPPPAMQKHITEISDEFYKSSKILHEKISKIIEEATNELKKKKA